MVTPAPREGGGRVGAGIAGVDAGRGGGSGPYGRGLTDGVPLAGGIRMIVLAEAGAR